MAWNGSDSGAANSTQRTQSARDAKNAKTGERGRAGRETLPGGGRGAPALPKWWRGAAALAIVVVGGGLAWWWVGGRGGASVPDVPEVAHVPSLIKEQRPAAGGHAGRVTLPVATNAPTPAKPETPPPFQKRPGTLQLPDGTVLTFPAPKGDEIRKVYAYGHLYECDSKGNFRDISKRQLFHTAFEANFLGLANADKPFIPAFLTGLDPDEVKKFLQKPYQPIGDETVEEKAELQAYDEMRAAALQYMDEGGSFDDFVGYFAQQVKDERKTNALCLREVMTLYKEGRVVEAKEMAEAANALKEQKGLKPFKVPVHVQEAFDAIQE